MKTSKSATGTRKRTAKPALPQSPQDYLNAIADPARRRDMTVLHRLIRNVAPDLKPHLQYGFIGYGTYHYKYDSGLEGDWGVLGLSSRAAYISLYVSATDGKQYVAEKYRQRLPKADIGKSCVRFKRLSDVNLKVLEQLIREGVAALVSA